MTRILVFGKHGQLATALAEASIQTSFELVFVGSNEFNLIEQFSHIIEFIAGLSVDGVINASAFTDVDKAELQAPEEAWTLNALVPEQMAKACKANSIPFFHVSTESVFDGNNMPPHKPYDATSPANYYGLSKLEGERGVLAEEGQGGIFRTSWVFSTTGHNFVKSILRVAKKYLAIEVVNDQIGLPTYAPDLANALLYAAQIMIAQPSFSYDTIYHIANGGGSISRYDFAKLIVDTAGLKTRVVPISSSQFDAVAPRPENAVLDTQGFTSTFGLELPDWRIGLQQVLSKVGRLNEQ